MLSIRTLTGAGGAVAGYLEKESAEKDYWGKEAGRSTEWIGRGSERLGLAGAVSEEDFKNIMDGRLPDGTQLPGGGKAGERRMGFDLTFSAPKSLSIQALAIGDQGLIDDHFEAMKAALKYAEENAAFVRVRDGEGVRLEQTDNLAVAKFQHQTSRNSDPQIHGHAVVANFSHGEDKWRAIESRELYRQKMAIGAVYRAELAERVKARGYRIRMTNEKQGLWELEGYSKKQLESFSSRRQEIEARLKDSTVGDSRAAERAALQTRGKKKQLDGTGKAKLRQEWKAQAKSLGIEVKPDKAKDLNVSAQQRAQAAEKAVDATLKDFAGRRKPITRQRVMGAAMARAVGSGAKSQDVAVAIDRAVSKGKLARLDSGHLAVPPKRQSYGLASRLAYAAGAGPILKTAKIGDALARGQGKKLTSDLGRSLSPAPLRLLSQIAKTEEEKKEKGMSV